MELSISFCIPVHNRTYDLKKTLTETIKNNPSVEVIILNYNSQDDLEEYLSTQDCTHIKYTGRNYFHMAHARNLSVLAASGEYIVILSADICPTENFIPIVHEKIKSYDCLIVNNYRGVLVCKKQEFIEAGGYDERFEFYGPEDTDLELRLRRRGNKIGILSSDLLTVIPTPNNEKSKNYRLPLSKWAMSQLMRPILEENIKNNVLVANSGHLWGQWD